MRKSIHATKVERLLCALSRIRKIAFIVIVFNILLLFPSLTIQAIEIPRPEELKAVYDYDHSAPFNEEIHVSIEDDAYTRYLIRYDSINGERVPAHLYIPKEYNPEINPNDKKAVIQDKVRRKHSLAFSPPWPVVFFMHFHVSDKSLAYIFATGPKGWASARGLAVFAIDGVYRGERDKEGKDIIADSFEENRSKHVLRE